MMLDRLVLLVVLFIVGHAVDHIFQLEWVLKNKNNKMSPKDIRRYTLILHSLAYSIMTYLITTVITGFDISIWVWLVLYVSHLIIDSRIINNRILKLKGLSDADCEDYKNYDYIIMSVDQALHNIVLLLIFFFYRV